MSYSVSAITSNGPINLHSGSSAQIRDTMAEARKDGATTVSLAENGKAITEADLSKLTSSLVKYA